MPLRKKNFVQTIEQELARIVREGIDKKSLLAGLNYYEFRYREADFGSYPKGLMYGLQALGSWVYDDQGPFLHIEANETYARLRARVEEGYFEELVKKYLLENPHGSMVRPGA